MREVTKLSISTCQSVTEPLGAEALRAFSSFDAAFAREGLKDSRDEIGPVAVFRIRHFVDFADETFRKADRDLRHARSARAYFTFFSHDNILLQGSVVFNEPLSSLLCRRFKG